MGRLGDCRADYVAGVGNGRHCSVYRAGRTEHHQPPDGRQAAPKPACGGFARRVAGALVRYFGTRIVFPFEIPISTVFRCVWVRCYSCGFLLRLPTMDLKTSVARFARTRLRLCRVLPVRCGRRLSCCWRGCTFVPDLEHQGDLGFCVATAADQAGGFAAGGVCGRGFDPASQTLTNNPIPYAFDFGLRLAAVFCKRFCCLPWAVGYTSLR